MAAMDDIFHDLFGSDIDEGGEEFSHEDFVEEFAEINELSEGGEGYSDGQVHDVIEGPKVGMRFDSLEDLFNLYQAHARLQGFCVLKASGVKGKNGERKFQTFSCHRVRIGKVYNDDPCT
ncbi:hypothetical protein ACOSQ4_027426 [Xanthoceras sorbifolium]